jgi:hypothetical protein
MPSEDDIAKFITVALLLAHIAVLIAVLRFRARLGWMVGLNLLVSAGVMIYWAPRFSELFGYVDIVLAFVGFELAVLTVSILAALRVRIPPAIHWIAFAANALLSVNALIFMLTFRITRLM